MRSIDRLESINAEDVNQARAEIQKARDLYENVARESGDMPALMQESLLGAGKANETLGDLGKAHQFYARLAKDYPNTRRARRPTSASRPWATRLKRR